MVSYILRFGAVILAVLPVWLLIRRPWKRKLPREWALGAFVLFAAALLALALEGEYGMPSQMADSAILRIRTGEGVNLVPFRTILRFIRHFDTDLFGVNIVGNIVMFIPWGFGLVLLWKKNRKIRVILALSLSLTLFIETCQLFIGRSADVDDLILNFAGSCLGAGLYFLLKRRWPGIERFAE